MLILFQGSAPNSLNTKESHNKPKLAFANTINGKIQIKDKRKVDSYSLRKVTSQSKLCFLSLDQFANMHYPPQFCQYKLVAFCSRNKKANWHLFSCDSVLLVFIQKITVRVNINCPGNTFHATFCLVTCSNIIHCIFIK